MPRIFCAAMDCEFNGDDGKCHAKDVTLSDHSIITRWEGQQRFQKCKTYQKSREATEMEQFFIKAVEEAKKEMDDLISRAALLKECAECQKTDPRFDERGWANHFINDAGEPSTEWYCVEDIIENAPAVDAVPVVHGKWQWLSSTYDRTPCEMSYWCSKCKHETITHGSEPWEKYCPHCGAKMDKED